ncbi:MAG: NUDIX hydrolase [Candidatus Sericytochromatia bacterium]|uniref:NUDIX hydrolase n=1 Tax=Candidatus Tanganyikabacteria bacterium TaxID=2961651 RepID=A0A938BMS4_9BACT|nr:NUDIX hydrolase [Candidatus Tanganyikabacteria bacterium]
MPTDEFQHLRERGLTQESVYRGDVVKVRVDTVALPNGEIFNREIVEHPGSVAIVALTPDEQLVMVRQFRYAIGRVTLELPAGTCAFGETPETTARRELREEVGCDAGNLQELGEFYVAPGYGTEVIRLFLATDLKDFGAVSPDSDEFLEPARLSLDEAMTMVRDGRIVDAKSIIGLFKLVDMRRGVA